MVIALDAIIGVVRLDPQLSVKSAKSESMATACSSNSIASVPRPIEDAASPSAYLRRASSERVVAWQGTIVLGKDLRGLSEVAAESPNDVTDHFIIAALPFATADLTQGCDR